MKNSKKKKWWKLDWEKFGDKYSLIFLFIGILSTIGAPIFLTLGSRWEWFDFSDTGEIGDTIGGTTAPFVGLIGAIFVFISFKAQIQANRIQQRALKEEKQRNEKKDNFNTLSTLMKENQESFEAKPADSLYQFQQDFMALTQIYITDYGTFGEISSGPKFQEIFQLQEIFGDYYKLFKILHILLSRIQTYDLNDNDRNLLIELCEIYYNTKLKNNVDGILQTYYLIRAHESNHNAKIEFGIPEDKRNFFTILIDINEFYEKGTPILVNKQ